MKQPGSLFLVFVLSLTTILFAASLQADRQHQTMEYAVDKLPIFDAHMHYKSEAWTRYPPNVVLSLMDRNGVAMALVSSSPDDGTIILWRHAPNRIIKEMRPYNHHLGPSTWTKGTEVGDTIEQRVRQFKHQGIGEFHLHKIDPRDELIMKRIVALALELQIPLHVHSDHEPVEYLYSLDPRLTIIWAHSGMTENVEMIETMMQRFPSLYADTTYREDEILNENLEIDEDWRQMLERFSDRFMVGSDTWTNSQWEDYDQLMETNRRWLAQLSPQAAHNIAYRNAERLFKIKITDQLIGTK